MRLGCVNHVVNPSSRLLHANASPFIFCHQMFWYQSSKFLRKNDVSEKLRKDENEWLVFCCCFFRISCASMCRGETRKAKENKGGQTKTIVRACQTNTCWIRMADTKTDVRPNCESLTEQNHLNLNKILRQTHWNRLLSRCMCAFHNNYNQIRNPVSRNDEKWAANFLRLGLCGAIKFMTFHLDNKYKRAHQRTTAYWFDIKWISRTTTNHNQHARACSARISLETIR